MVLPEIERHGPIEAWIIDDTGIPKKERHSVGVSHQYCGQLGKQANCQVAVTLSLANHDASLPVAYRLYLPKAWAEDDERRYKAGVPEDVTFKTKPEIALDHIRWAHETGLPGKIVLLDAGYGNDSKLRAAITERERTYVAGILPQTLVWQPGVPPGLWQAKHRSLHQVCPLSPRSTAAVIADTTQLNGPSNLCGRLPTKADDGDSIFSPS
jgi:SRSO17 transposase